MQRCFQMNFDSARSYSPQEWFFFILTCSSLWWFTFLFCKLAPSTIAWNLLLILSISSKTTLKTRQMVTSFFKRRLSASLVVCQASLHFRVFNRSGWTRCFHNVQDDNFISTDSSNTPLLGALLRDSNSHILTAIQGQSIKTGLPQMLFCLKRWKEVDKVSSHCRTVHSAWDALQGCSVSDPQGEAAFPPKL